MKSIGQMNGHFEDWSWGIQPQVGPLGQSSPQFCGLLLRGILKPEQAFRGLPKHKKRGRMLSVKRQCF